MFVDILAVSISFLLWPTTKYVGSQGSITLYNNIGWNECIEVVVGGDWEFIIPHSSDVNRREVYDPGWEGDPGSQFAWT